MRDALKASQTSATRSTDTPGGGPPGSVRRRGLLALGSAVLGGLLARVGASPAQATDNQPLLVSQDNSATGSTTVARTNATVRSHTFRANNTNGIALYGVTTSPDPALSGRNAGTGGTGVQGYSEKGIGVYGLTSSGTGVQGYSEKRFGVYGINGKTSGRTGDVAGVLGQGTVEDGGRFISTDGTGVYAQSTNSAAVWGESAAGRTFAVMGISTGDGGVGVHGMATVGEYPWAIHGYAIADSAFARAGFFQGTVEVAGTLLKSAGSFRIDHPLNPATKYLSHSFVESPEMKNIYDGVATLDARGEAVVSLPAWFEALNRDVRYQLTCIGGFQPVYIAQKVRNNQFKIAGGTPGLDVSWQLTGIRQDAYAKAHPILVEEDKPAVERGHYLHPQLYGQPEEKGITWARKPELMQRLKAQRQRGPATPPPAPPPVPVGDE